MIYRDFLLDWIVKISFTLMNKKYHKVCKPINYSIHNEFIALILPNLPWLTIIQSAQILYNTV